MLLEGLKFALVGLSVTININPKLQRFKLGAFDDSIAVFVDKVP